MNRLIENTVFSGFVMAWRFATCPTRISPSLVNATTDGVRRLPSWLGMTVGLPPSITATTEFVVPRSIPITLAIFLRVLSDCSRRHHRRHLVYGEDSGEGRSPLRVQTSAELTRECRS